MPQEKQIKSTEHHRKIHGVAKAFLTYDKFRLKMITKTIVFNNNREYGPYCTVLVVKRCHWVVTVGKKNLLNILTRYIQWKQLYFYFGPFFFSDGSHWAHVNCAWWIPGVKFGNPKEMEPIVGINKIPVSSDIIFPHQKKIEKNCFYLVISNCCTYSC